MRCSWVPLRRRLPTLQDGVDGRSREGEEEGEEEEEVSPKEFKPEEEEIAMADGGVGFSALLGFGRKKEFAVKKSRFGVRLNSEKMKTDRQFHVLRGASCRHVASSLVVVVCFNEH